MDCQLNIIQQLGGYEVLWDYYLENNLIMPADHQVVADIVSRGDLYKRFSRSNNSWFSMLYGGSMSTAFNLNKSISGRSRRHYSSP